MARLERLLGRRLRRKKGGRALGDESFLRKIGRLLGRDLVAMKPGPKARKSKVRQ